MSYHHSPEKTAPGTPLCLLAALVLAAIGTPAWAQIRPYGAGDAARDANTPTVPERPTPPPAPVITQEPNPAMTLGDGQTLHVNDFKVEGVEFLDPKEVAALLEPYRHRDLTIIDIDAAANRITVLARSKGYMVARAYVPKQDAQGGTLLIRMIPGQYGKFQLKNSSLVRDWLLQGMFDSATRGSAIVTRASLERAMLLVYDLPGAGLPQVNIAPGAAPGTSDFLAAVPPDNRVSGFAAYDNYGSPFTGRNRVSAGLDINSPLGLGDRFSLSGLSSERNGLQNGRAAYAFPLSYSGLRAELAASKTTYKLGGQFADLDATGNAHIFEGTLSYPLKRSRDDSITVSLNLAEKHLRDDIAVVSSSVAKRDRVATLSLQRDIYGSLFGFNNFSSFATSFSYGRLDFEDPVQGAFNRAGVNTLGEFYKVNASYNGTLSFSSKWSLLSSLLLQQALGKNLDPIEQLSLSGPAGIRSYPDGVTGDTGFLWGEEVRYALPRLAAADQSVGLFGNYGAVRPERDTVSTSGEIRIGDAGLAYYASYKAMFLRVQVARNFGAQPGTGTYNHSSRVLAQAGVRF